MNNTTPVSEVYLMDCIEGMKNYPDKYFDLAMVDPPYGINIGKFKTMGKKGKVNITKYNKSNWDNNIPNKDYFEQLFRISKNQIIWGGNYFIEHLRNTSCVIIWDKHYIPEGFTMADLEMAWTSFNKPSKKVRIKKNYIANCISNNKEKALQFIKIHPTQKPVALYDWIFKNYSEPHFKILDTHLGSGSSRISAYKAKLHFVGFEIDKEYFDNQEKRFNQFKSQLTLF